MPRGDSFTTLFPFQVGWVKSDTKAIQAIGEHVITNNPRVSVFRSPGGSHNLKIANATLEDAGSYMCQLNTAPMKSQVRTGIGSNSTCQK